MEHSGPGDIIVKSSNVFKVKFFTQVTEFLIVNSLKHPNIIGCEGIEFTSYEDYNSSCTMKMEKGVKVDLSVENFLIILETLIYLERHGITYGDLKTHNMVMVDGVVKLIDFGLINFSGLDYRCVSQTYGDELQYTWNIENEKYSHKKNLIWAIGILALEFFGDIRFSSKFEYGNFVFLKEALLSWHEEKLKEWYSFIEVCLMDYNDRIDSVEELWKSLPSKYYREMNIHSEELSFNRIAQKPSDKWYAQLDIIPFWIYTYLEVYATRSEITFRAISLFKEYYHWFIESDTQVTEVMVSNDMLSFACACILLTADLFGETIDIISLSDNLDGEIKDEEISSMFVKFIEKLDFCLPSILIEKVDIFGNSFGLHALLHGITNVNNYSQVRTNLNEVIQINETGTYVINFKASQYVSNFLKEWSQKINPGFIIFTDDDTQ